MITKADNTFYDVVGIGNAIVDVLAKVGNGFLSERSLKKGEMTLVEAKDAGVIYQDLIPEREVSGGSAANTVAAIASLGGAPAFIGKIHDDELGQVFKRDIGLRHFPVLQPSVSIGSRSTRLRVRIRIRCRI